MEYEQWEEYAGMRSTESGETYRNPNRLNEYDVVTLKDGRMVEVYEWRSWGVKGWIDRYVPGEWYSGFERDEIDSVRHRHKAIRWLLGIADKFRDWRYDISKKIKEGRTDEN